MKRLLKYIFICLSVAILISSCSDNDNPSSGSEPAISLSSEVIQVTKEGGSETITVTSTGDWKLSGLADWVHPSATSGKNGDVVTFTIDPVSTETMLATTFKFFTESAVAPLKIEVQPSYSMELNSDKEIECTTSNQTFSVILKTNVAEPDIQYSNGSGEWISLEKSTEFMGIRTLTFNVAENKTYKKREGVISISSELVDTPVEISVSQAQVNAIIPEVTSITNDLKARTITLKLQYNVDYTVSITKGEGWISQEAMTPPQIGTDGLAAVEYKFKLEEASTSRVGTIHIGSKDNKLSSDIAIVQKDPNAKIISIPDNSLRTFIEKQGWVMVLGSSQCLMLDEGYNATELSNPYGSSVSDLTGIENFTNLKTIKLPPCWMGKIDISGLHKVETFTCESASDCSTYNLGDNPIKTFSTGGQFAVVSVDKLTFISTNLESMDLSLSSWWAYRDEVTAIDVSECPKLKTLNIKRSDKLKQLILKKGQTIPNLTKDDFTEIVYK